MVTSTTADRSPAGDAVRIPSVLVILVTRDAAGWLRECLQSLAAQTHPRLGVVAVDNGSTDGTRELLIQALGERRVVALAENRGLAGALRAVVGAPGGRRRRLPPGPARRHGPGPGRRRPARRRRRGHQGRRAGRDRRSEGRRLGRSPRPSRGRPFHRPVRPPLLAPAGRRARPGPVRPGARGPVRVLLRDAHVPRGVAAARGSSTSGTPGTTTTWTSAGGPGSPGSGS